MAKARKLRRPQHQKNGPEKSADEIYGELLREVGEPSREPERPLKKRRVGNRTGAEASTAPPDPVPEVSPPVVKVEDASRAPSSTQDDEDHASMPKQTTYDESESSPDDDVNWDQLVDPTGDESTANLSGQDENPFSAVALDMNKSRPSNAGKKRSARPPFAAAEKTLRLTIHKLHICTLMAHLYIRNHWCNNEKLQASLRRLVSPRTRQFLFPSSDQTQYDQSAQLVRGLEEASLAFRGAFKVTEGGMRRAKWAEDAENLRDLEGEPNGLRTESEFVRAGKDRRGSRDFGAQLFCAMLRSVDVDARLVCSLQVLPLTGGGPPPATSTMTKPTVDFSSHASQVAGATDDDTDASMKSTSTAGPHRIKRFGQNLNTDARPLDQGKAPTSASKARRMNDSPYPVFWVEVFNTARQKWQPVDPLATQTVNKPAKLEPPASDRLNAMTYVVAFEDDGSARDVTRRYAKAYNAKTRKARVESTQNGERWYRKALKIFTTSPSDRDAIESAELSKREADEALPRNLADFKAHPYYALVRHLHRNEVIHPLRQVGKVSVGKSATSVTEPIYRRRDVVTVKSADKWYRLGREIIEGEQPLKLVTERRRPRSVEDSEEGDKPRTVGLFAFHQTTAYVPPPVLKGRIPKNIYGNLDLYVPGMIPPGAVHVRAFDAAAAARCLGIDYADAVVGFTFKGRKGTAVTNGVVVAKEHRAAMEEVIGGLRWERVRSAMEKRSQEALRMWKRFIVGLRIRERVMAGDDDDDDDDGNGEGRMDENKIDVRDAIDAEEADETKRNAQGGFFLDADQGPVAQPTASRNPDQATDIEILRAAAPPMLGGDIDDLLPARLMYWEPTVTSPWDLPGALGQTESPKNITESEPKPEPAAPPDAGHFGEEPAHNESGGFLLDEPAGSEHAGGFVRDDEPATELSGDRAFTGGERSSGEQPPGSRHQGAPAAVRKQSEAEELSDGFLPAQETERSRSHHHHHHHQRKAAPSEPSVSPPAQAEAPLKSLAQAAPDHDSASSPPREPFTIRSTPPPLSRPPPQSEGNKANTPSPPPAAAAAAAAAAASTPSESVAQAERRRSSEEEADAHGLMLEDPEDEDLEPDWLVEETGF